MSIHTVRPEVLRLRPYVPGKPIAEVRREYGLSHVVKLASNENPLGPSPEAVAALRTAASDCHIYPEASARLVREALAAHLSLPEDWIMVGNGSDELLRLLAATYIRPGDRCLAPDCSFPNYQAVAELFGAHVATVPLKAETMDLRATASLAEGARFIFLCRPNNPTGAVFAAAEFDWFMEQISPETFVLLDEAYHEYDETGFNALTALERFPNLIITRTFSKAYGLAGLRVGYGLAHPEVWHPLYTVREPFSVNLLAQAAAVAALTDQDHLQAVLDNHRLGKLFLAEMCRDLGLYHIPTQGNFVMISLGRPAEPVYAALLRQGVIVRPCGGFGRPDSIRVTIGTPEQNQLFAEALKQALAETEGGGKA